MRKNLLLSALPIAAAFLFVSPSALADDTVQIVQVPPPAPAPAPAGATTTKVEAAPGSTGLTVVVPTAGGGTVTAVGCSAVTVTGHSTDVKSGDPCPTAAPAPVNYGVSPPPPAKPRYEPDSARKAAIITAPIVYGVGAMLTGISYLSRHESCDYSYTTGSGYRTSCSKDNGTTALVGYGAITALVPSMPRWTVGDVGRAIGYSAARAGSVIAAVSIDWGHDNDSWMGPFVFGFAAPVALAVVDMATTPHREDLMDPADKDKAAKANDSARITSIAPVAMGNKEHKAPGAGVAVGGVF